MALSNDDAMMSGLQTDVDTPESLTLKLETLNNISDSDGSKSEKSIDYSTAESDQWPRGFKLFLLSGASLVAVFLIALDQVRVLALDPG